jgi:hypothetical protein
MKANHTSSPSDHDIRLRAHAIYEQRMQQAANDDWLEAEADLSQQVPYFVERLEELSVTTPLSDTHTNGSLEPCVRADIIAPALTLVPMGVGSSGHLSAAVVALAPKTTEHVR